MRMTVSNRRKVYTSTLRTDLFNRLAALQVDLKEPGKTVYKSRLTDEAIEDLLNKYENKKGNLC